MQKKGENTFMLRCESCGYCNQGKKVSCPFYMANMEDKDIRVIIKDARKDKMSKLYLAVCLLQGNLVKKNTRKAISILKKLCRNDYIPAMYILSTCYFEGNCVEKDLEYAFELCEAAAMKGCNLAEIKLYNCYKNAIGVKRDFIKAKEWCGLAAYHQSKEMYFPFAEMCTNSQYGETNFKNACKFYELSYDNGNKKALDSLVLLHKNHLEECSGLCLPKESGWLANYYEGLAKFCATNKYAPDIVKAVGYYKQAIDKLYDEIHRIDDYEKDPKNSNRIQLLCMYRISLEETPEKLNKRIEELKQKIEEYYKKYFTQYTKNVDEKNFYIQANKGDDLAQYQLYLLFSDESFALYDIVEAFHWCGLAAKNGNVDAQYTLGCCYHKGIGVRESLADAVKWYQLAAEREHSQAQYELGECYYFGRGIEKDYDEAFKWIIKAANSGHGEAQASAGVCYYYGKGVEKDFTQSFNWSLLAAKQGIVSAMKDLGLDYYEGVGTRQDYKQAIKWFTLSAERSNEFAQFFLGECYAKGRGVEQDYTQALKWYELSAKQGLEMSKKEIEKINDLFAKAREEERRQQELSNYNTDINYIDYNTDDSPEIPVPVEPTPILCQQTIYYDWRTGEPLFYDQNWNIVNSAGEEVPLLYCE